jgi:hypothetical protein
MDEERMWGPSHQDLDPPSFTRRHPIAAVLVGLPLLLFGLELLRLMLGFGGGFPSLFGWLIRAAIVVVLARFALMLVMSALAKPPRTAPARKKPPPLRTPLGRPRPGPPGHTGAQAPAKPKGISPATRAREGTIRLGGGAYLGADEHGGWVTANPESAVMVLGPPGLVSYCTSAVSR